MCNTFTCLLSEESATFSNAETGDVTVLSRKAFDALIKRRQRLKLSMTTRIAGGLYSYFDLGGRIEQLGSDPQNTPLVICNRYANWDYVADAICDDVSLTLDAVNSYVATAWFPAAVQGYLTIEHGNKGEALTIACADIEIYLGAVDSVFKRDSDRGRVGVVLAGTFEVLPPEIGGRKVKDARAAVFGAFSLISAVDSDEQIQSALTTHLELYNHAAD